jgi:hypothetical protein
MNEYELVDAMSGLQSNLIQGQAVTITILSAYMVVAYTVGAKLTKFQSTFVSIMFILFGLLGAMGQVSILNEVYHYGAQLRELRGSHTMTVDGDGSFWEAPRWLLLIVRLFLFSGALYFMWSVRHPKTE